MKIAFIYDALYPEVKGGGERRLYELGKRLAKRHEVHWYTFGWWGEKKEIEREGILVRSIGQPVPLYRGDIRNPWEALVFSFRLLGVKLDSYDVIDCQAFPYLHVYFLKSRLPFSDRLVITWYEYWGDYWKHYLGMSSYLGVFAERGLLWLTDNHIAISRHTLKRLARIRSGRFGLVPGGIDFNLIHSIPPHPELRYDAIFVGRLIGHKNVELLLRALRLIIEEVPSFRVGIIGDGPQRNKLELMAKRLGVDKNVDFLGFLPHFEDVISIVKSSKVFAFPSFREGFGIVVLEANASGVPAVVVRTSMNASSELIFDGKNGYVSDPTHIDFARKLLLAWEESPRMRHPSVSYARRYDWDNVANQLENYYKGVVDGS